MSAKAPLSLDCKFPYILYGKLVSGPHYHARIISIDTSKAGTIPGVRVVATPGTTPIEQGECYNPSCEHNRGNPGELNFESLKTGLRKYRLSG